MEKFLLNLNPLLPQGEVLEKHTRELQKPRERAELLMAIYGNIFDILTIL